jgi:hypothetical protein
MVKSYLSKYNEVICSNDNSQGPGKKLSWGSTVCGEVYPSKETGEKPQESHFEHGCLANCELTLHIQALSHL